MENSLLPPRRLSNPSLWQHNVRLNQFKEVTAKYVTGCFAIASIFTTFGIIWSLIQQTIEFFGEVSFVDFFTDTQWTPLFVNPQYGIFVLMSATVMTSAIAISVALPLGLFIAICLSEFASAKARRFLKPIVELLAGVPTVVYGYFALLFVTPLLRQFVPGLQQFNALSAGLIMGLAITPLVASLSEDAIYSVPQNLRQGAYAVGATRQEVITGVVLPAALSGIVAAVILAVSRAVGETMIVSIAAGQNPRLTFDPRVPVATMTAFIAQVSLGDVPVMSIEYKTIFAVGMTLFLLTLSLNVFSYWFVRRFREKYE